MSSGPTGGWREQMRHREQVAQQARATPRPPAAPWARTALGLAVAGWALVVVWLAMTLPEQVPTHWSGDALADGWSSRTGALALWVLLPVVTLTPLLWASRLVLHWPDMINIAHKDWWLASADRVVRLERQMREDLMLIVAMTLALFTVIGVEMGRAAHRPGGRVDTWFFPTVTGVFIIAIVGYCLWMAFGSRYRRDAQRDAARPAEDHDRP